MTDQSERPADETPEEPTAMDEAGRKMGSFMGRVTLYDPRGWDVSRGNRPIEPAEPTVIETSRIIVEALAAAGYHATVDLTRTDNER